VSALHRLYWLVVIVVTSETTAAVTSAVVEAGPSSAVAEAGPSLTPPEHSQATRCSQVISNSLVTVLGST